MITWYRCMKCGGLRRAELRSSSVDILVCYGTTNQCAMMTAGAKQHRYATMHRRVSEFEARMFDAAMSVKET